MTAEAENGLNVRQLCHDAASPMTSTLGAWWAIRAAPVIAWKAEAHGQERKSRRIIELLTPYSEPGSEPVAGGIIKRKARAMGAQSRRLTDDQKPRLSRELQYRAWRMRQRRSHRMVQTEAAAAYLFKQCLKPGHGLASR
jgi:hypothetical protein